MREQSSGSLEAFKYWAFISYSHQDKTWGDWLHEALETYRVPRRLVGKPSRDGVVPRRAFPIFRDREELPGSSSLGENISEALRASRYLIVICSPRSAVSRWVNQEIRSYKAMGREDRVLCLIVEGEPNASSKPELGLLECFPEAVRFRVNREAEITSEPTEPIAADARPGKDGKANAKLKLLSGVIGVAYDELKQRDKQRRVRRRIQITMATTALCALIAGVFIWKENQRRQEERVAASKSDAAAALKALDQGAADQALAWLARSVRGNPRNTVARSRLISLLSQRNWALPVGPAMAHGKAITGAQFSPDGKRVVTASAEGNIRFWDANSGDPLTPPIAHRGVVSVDFSLDGNRVVSAGQPDARVWDAANGHQTGPVFKHERALQMARFSRDGNLIVTASADGTARLWNANDGKEIFPPLPHAAPLMQAILSPDGQRVVTATVLHKVRLWDAATGLPISDNIPLKGMPFALEFSPDGTQLICAGSSVEVFSSGTMQPSYPALPAEGVRAARFSPDGKVIFTASVDKLGRFWDAATGQPVLKPLSHNEALLCAAFSRDGERVITGTTQGAGRIWDVKSGRAVSEPFRQSGELVLAEFSPDGTRALTASKDGSAHLWDARPRGLLPLALTSPGRVLSGKFDDSSQQFISTTKDGVVQRWEVATGELLSTTSVTVPLPASLSADGQRRAEIDGANVRVFDVASGKPVAPEIVHPLPLLAVALNSDGSRIVTSCIDKSVRLFQVQDAKPLFDPIKHPELVRTVAFSGDDKRIVTGCFDKAVRVWDGQSGRLLVEPIWHGAIVSDAQFSHDGKRLVTGSLDGRAQIWSAETGELLSEPYQHEAEGVHFVRLSPDGRWLAVSIDQTVFVWDALQLPDGTPGWTADLAEAVGGLSVDRNNLIEPIKDRWQLLQRIRDRISHETDGAFSRWAMWMLQNSADRTISPSSRNKKSSAAAPAPSPVNRSVPAPPSPSAPVTASGSTDRWLFIALVQHGIYSVETMKDPGIASQSYERALPLGRKLASAQPQDLGAQRGLATLLSLLGEAFALQGQAEKSLGASHEAVALNESLHTSKPNELERRNLLAQSLSSLAYCQNLLKHPSDAMAAALRASELDSSSITSRINLATAYLLSDQYAKAEPIFLEIKDLKLGSKRCGDLIIELLDELKERGIDHPDAGKIRELVRDPAKPSGKPQTG